MDHDVTDGTEIHIPFHPVPFARPRFNNGRGFNSPKYADYKRTIQTWLMSLKLTPMEGPLSLALVFLLEKPKRCSRRYPAVRPDLDNFVKAMMDCGNEVLWHDDGQIVHIGAMKIYGEPGIHLVLNPLLDALPDA
jgi:Holliday junction resolvase RusA-like endonuclease